MGSVEKKSSSSGELRSRGTTVLTSHVQQGRIYVLSTWPMLSHPFYGVKAVSGRDQRFSWQGRDRGKLLRPVFLICLYFTRTLNFFKPLIVYSVLAKSFFAP